MIYVNFYDIIAVLEVTKSRWGTNEDCSFATFTPLFQGITGIVFITLFMVCGNGGSSNKTYVYLD